MLCEVRLSCELAGLLVNKSRMRATGEKGCMARSGILCEGRHLKDVHLWGRSL